MPFVRAVSKSSGRCATAISLFTVSSIGMPVIRPVLDEMRDMWWGRHSCLPNTIDGRQECLPHDGHDYSSYKSTAQELAVGAKHYRIYRPNRYSFSMQRAINKTVRSAKTAGLHKKTGSV